MKTKGLCTTLLAAGLLAFPITATAQVAVGVSAGLTFATFTGDDIDDDVVESSTGFFVGGSLGIPLSDIISLGTGAYYVQKGTEDDLPGGDFSVDVDYIEIPAILQVQVTGPERPVGVSLMAGPALGFSVSCDASISDGTTTLTGDCGDSAKGVDFGLLFGAGVSFPTSETMSFFVDGGIDIGLTSVFDEDEVDSTLDDIKNQTWFLGAGLSWIVGG